jgi:hypothetical protein
MNTRNGSTAAAVKVVVVAPPVSAATVMEARTRKVLIVPLATG